MTDVSAEEEAVREQVRLRNEAGALVTWSPCWALCPQCGERPVEVRQAYQAKPLGTFSLAGVQLKFPATLIWQYRCTACGATGPAEPK